MSAPILNHEGPSTPATEWAKDTANALGSTTATGPTSSSVSGGVGTGATTIGTGGPTTTTDTGLPHSAVPLSTATRTGNAADTSAFAMGAAPSSGTDTTPNVPGAYPRDVTTDFGNAIEGARQYLPEREQVQATLTSAGQTVASYLPENMGAKLQSFLPGQNANTTGTTTAGIETSLPSTEHSGTMAGESSHGAGSLPGLNIEPGVAVLPDERTGLHGSIPTAAGVGAMLTGGAAAAGYAAKSQYMSATGHPASTLQEIADNTKPNQSMPTMETTGRNQEENVGGVGALSGSVNEPAVALAPAERTSLPSHEYDGHIAGENTGGGVGALPGGINETGVARLPMSKENSFAGESAPAPPVKDKETSLVDSTPPGKDKQMPLLDTSSQTKSTAPAGHTYPSTSTFNSTSDPASASPTSAKTNNSNSSQHKAKLMDKIKGEAKIVAGKVSGKPEKVEEGKLLKSGLT